jgi:hypothetical protein
MATVFEPIRPVPPITTIFIVNPPVFEDTKLQHRRKSPVAYRSDINPTRSAWFN